MVPIGFRIACRRASWPTSRSPFSVNATTDGVVRDPSAFGMTEACPPSHAAITEFVVPRSMPTARAMWSPWCWCGRTPAAGRGQVGRRSGCGWRPLATGLRPFEHPGGLVGHLVVDEQLEALRAHGGHGCEVAPPALQGVDEQSDQRADDRAED